MARGLKWLLSNPSLAVRYGVLQADPSSIWEPPLRLIDRYRLICKTFLTGGRRADDDDTIGLRELCMDFRMELRPETPAAVADALAFLSNVKVHDSDADVWRQAGDEP